MATEEDQETELGDLSVHKTSTKIVSQGHELYWRRRIYRRKKGGEAAGEWLVKLQRDGRREVFNLRVAKASAAAVKAREIAVCLEANGWEATRARFKRRGTVEPLPEGTVGAFLQAHAVRSTLKPERFKAYALDLRKIVSFIARVPSGLSRFDHFHGGDKEWRDKVEAVPLAALSKANLEHWHAAYVAKAAGDPMKRKSAERSAATILRQARALFQGTENNPFRGVKIKAPRPERYSSAVNPFQLTAHARAELSAPCFVAFCLCLLAGLRKREADLLEWSAVDLERGLVRIVRTQWFSPKTEDSLRDIDIGPDFVELLRAHRGEGSGFVLAGRAPKPVDYRAEKIWKQLAAWLRGRGFKGQKPIHALRKESGSLIAQSFGIEAARAHLGHQDIQTTSAHYVAKKERREITLRA